jgi:hypothetical protein
MKRSASVLVHGILVERDTGYVHDEAGVPWKELVTRRVRIASRSLWALTALAALACFLVFIAEFLAIGGLNLRGEDMCYTTGNALGIFSSGQPFEYTRIDVEHWPLRVVCAVDLPGVPTWNAPSEYAGVEGTLLATSISLTCLFVASILVSVVACRRGRRSGST